VVPPITKSKCTNSILHDNGQIYRAELFLNGVEFVIGIIQLRLSLRLVVLYLDDALLQYQHFLHLLPSTQPYHHTITQRRIDRCFHRCTVFVIREDFPLRGTLWTELHHLSLCLSFARSPLSTPKLEVAWRSQSDYDTIGKFTIRYDTI